jgi:hypothetical protein
MKKEVSKFDKRFHTEIQKILKRAPSMQYQPLIGIYDLQEVMKIIEVLPKLEFPINSAGELIEKLGRSGKHLQIAMIKVDPVRMIKYMPTYYFPIADMANFIEKMSELIRQNRHEVDVPKEIKTIKEQVEGILEFPIKDRNSLAKMLENSGKMFTFQGSNVNLSEVITHIPHNYFPIESEKEFFNKIRTLMVTRPLIVPHK